MGGAAAGSPQRFPETIANFHLAANAGGPVVIDGENQGCLFRIWRGAQVYMKGISVTGAQCGSFGGAFFVGRGDLTLEDCNVYNNNARAGGGVFIAEPWPSLLSDAQGNTFLVPRVRAQLYNTTVKGGGVFCTSGAHLILGQNTVIVNMFRSEGCKFTDKTLLEEQRALTDASGAAQPHTNKSEPLIV